MKMKIPKHIQNLIIRRERLANELMTVSTNLDERLEKQGIPLGAEYTMTGCMIYCEPESTRKCIEEDILNFRK